MEKEFGTYEIASKLEKLGFDEECLGHFVSNTLHIGLKSSATFLSAFANADCIEAPLWQQAIDFLKDKYDLHIVITVNPYSEIRDVNGYKIYDGKQELKCIINNEAQSWNYNFAREQAILKTIELIKQLRRNKND